MYDFGKHERRLTMAMEMVAKAKGSPRMFPKLTFLRAPYCLEWSILASDGGLSDPYEGIRVGIDAVPGYGAALRGDWRRLLRNLSVRVS
jgi:hypothetical protein